jgi:hypothetical protein
LHLFSFFNAHDLQVWSFNGIFAFLCIHFAALDSFVQEFSTKNSVCLVKVLEHWYWCLVFWALWGKECPSCWTAWGGDSWSVVLFFFFHFPWSYGPSFTSGNSDMVSPSDWLVSSTWLLLSTGQVTVEAWGNSLLVCARCSEMFLFSPGSSWVALQLQLCLVSSSPSKVGQFSFEYCPQSHETSSGIYHQATLGGWFVTPSPLSNFVCYLTSAWC